MTGRISACSQRVLYSYLISIMKISTNCMNGENKKWTNKHLLLWETKTHSTHNVWPRKQQQPSLYFWDFTPLYSTKYICCRHWGCCVKKVTSKNQLLLALWDKQNVALRIISKTPTRSTSYRGKQTWMEIVRFLFLAKRWIPPIKNHEDRHLTSSVWWCFKPKRNETMIALHSNYCVD